MNDARIITLQADLFDHTGHVRQGLSRNEAKRLVQEIDALRTSNGWRSLDMNGRWVPRGLPRVVSS